MTTQTIQKETVSFRLINQWEHVGEKLLALAEAIPEKKYDYRPIDEVRTFADVLRHVAFWNRSVADSARGIEGDYTANKLSASEFSNKKKIVEALQQSTMEASAALKAHRSGLPPEKVEMLVTFLEHNCEHYGQLVVYARLNAIVPPASQG